MKLINFDLFFVTKLILVSFIFGLLVMLLTNNSSKSQQAFAAIHPSCAPLATPGYTPRASGGLITAKSIAGNFGTTSGVCIIDANTNFLYYKLPTYNDLVKKFYDQSSSSSKKAADTVLNFSGGTNGLYRFTSNQTINSALTGSGTQVIFIDGNLTIDVTPSNILSFPSSGEGVLVFIVFGNINIRSTMTQVDAVLVSYGDICTAYNGTNCPASKITTNSKLVINGSLVSLKSAGGLKLMRQLDDNAESAELINYQPKVIPLLAKAGLLLEDLKIPLEQ